MKCPHRKPHYDGTTGSSTQRTSRCYSSQLVILYYCPSDMMNPKNVGPSPAVDIQTTVEQVNGGEMPKTSGVKTKFA